MRNVSGQFDHKRLQLLTVEGLQQRFQSWTLRNRVGLIQKNQACRDRVFAPASPDILAGTGRSDQAIGLKGTADCNVVGNLVLAPWHIRWKNWSCSKNGYAKEPAQDWRQLFHLEPASVAP